MITNITDEDKEQIRRFKDIVDRGRIAHSGKVTELYNKIFNRFEKPTRCGGCLRSRINKMWNALQELERKEKEEQQKKNAEEIKEN